MTLQTGDIRLRPLLEGDLAALTQLAADPAIWKTHREKYFEADTFKSKWFEPALEKAQQGKRCPFTIELDGKIVGSSSFYEIDDKHKRLTIGYTWFSPACWGSKLNVTSKFLMFEHVFETLSYQRIAFCIDEENIRSRKAVEKLGVQFEGILRKHVVRPDGSIRNSAIYSVIDDDWPEVKSALLDRLSCENS